MTGPVPAIHVFSQHQLITNMPVTDLVVRRRASAVSNHGPRTL
jgi:hypothetical protein